MLPGVCDVYLYFYRVVFKLHRSGIGLERGVGKAESEREHGLLPYGIEIPVSDVDAFFVIGVVVVSESADALVVVPCGPCGCQFSGRGFPSEQYVGKCAARLDSELGKKENVSHPLESSQVHGSSDIEDKHELFVCLVQGKDVPFFRIREKNIALDRPSVVAFSGVSGKDIDGSLG